MSHVLVALSLLSVSSPGEPASSPWSFAPLADVRPPAVRDASWPRADIDRFVRARLEERGLVPSRDASRASLLRRLCFDLTGLPPNPAEVSAFIEDDGPRAVERLVGRLIGSRRFGERWGRHWLDIARYSDSTGGGRTKALEDAWRYRDYVIDSFNRDKPFDRFLREQIAGDLLEWSTSDERRENLIATSFMVLGPHNYENQDKELLRMDVVDEQIDTIGRAFLAMTFGCARCHDHKFDPISTRDYYALAGIFRATKSLTPGNVSGFVRRELPVEGELAARLAEHRRRVEELENRLGAAKALFASLVGRSSSTGAKSSAPKRQPVKLSELPGVVVDDVAARRVGEWKSSTHHPRFVGAGYLHDENKGKGEKRVVFEPRIAKTGEYEVRLAYTPGTNRSPGAPVTIRHAGGKKTIRIDQRGTPPIDAIFVSLGRYRFERGGTVAVIVSNEGTRAHVIADAVQFLPVEEIATSTAAEAGATRDARSATSAAPEVDPDRERRLMEAETELKSLQKNLASLRRNGPKPPMTMSVRDEATIEDWHIHVRGEIRNLGPKVPRGFPAAIEVRDAPDIADDESGRRELAAWIASPSNPLTARVIVNRVWHWLFGTGLVRTVDNFGASGESPSHPELLDWLARRFVEEGWSVKWLVREIVLSRTYALSSRTSPETMAADPENRLLSHSNRRRLDAESMRDAILAASGALDLTPGGPAIDARAGKMAGNKVEYGYAFASNRRSVYVPVFRNSLLEVLDVFDFADPNLSVGCRAKTTRSTQALFLMNSPFLMDQSELAAKRILAIPDLGDSERLDRAYLGILGRRPTDDERRVGLAFVATDIDRASKSASARLERWAGLVQTLFSCIDFRFLN